MCDCFLHSQVRAMTERLDITNSVSPSMLFRLKCSFGALSESAKSTPSCRKGFQRKESWAAHRMRYGFVKGGVFGQAKLSLRGTSHCYHRLRWSASTYLW